jgi:UDP-glucose 4-epimerase
MVILVDMTAEEISQRETDKAKMLLTSRQQARQQLKHKKKLTHLQEITNYLNWD